ncbi:hypothetical protein BC01_161 [Bacillus phage BC01]|nr:hypothetical protein BC01_161 [Bacillus phage BC01]
MLLRKFLYWCSSLSTSRKNTPVDSSVLTENRLPFHNCSCSLSISLGIKRILSFYNDLDIHFLVTENIGIVNGIRNFYFFSVIITNGLTHRPSIMNVFESDNYSLDTIGISNIDHNSFAFVYRLLQHCFNVCVR